MSVWSRTAKRIEADALEDLRGHRRLQSPEGQAFLGELENLGNDPRLQPFLPWLAREFRKGRLVHYPGSEHPGASIPDWSPPPGFPYLKRAFEHPGQRGLYYDAGGLLGRLVPSQLSHWADWHASPDRRKVPLEQVQIPQMHEEVRQWERAMARKAKEDELMPHAPEGEVAHRFPDNWTIRRLPSSALPFEGWAMRGKPNPETGEEGYPICVGGPAYQKEVDKGNTMIYSLRDPQHMPHVTWEMQPTKHGVPGYQFDFDRARQVQLSHPNEHKRWPEPVFDKLRSYAANPNWQQLEDTPIDVPGWQDPEATHTMTHGQVFNQLMNYDREALRRPLPENAEINQIQGRGNSIPKPEYQQRLKQWFQTFPEEERPQWGFYGDAPYRDIRELDPDHPDYDPFEDEVEPAENEGGYRPHGDYGLAPPPLRKVEYDRILKGLADEEQYQPNSMNALYGAARDRDQIPELAQAAQSWQENTVYPSRSDLEDQNLDAIPWFPGGEWDEDPETWNEPDPAYESYYGQDDRSPQERWKDAKDAYDESQRELDRLHPLTQYNQDLWEKLQPHLNPQTNQYENFSSQTGFAAPQPQGTFSRTAAVDPRTLPYSKWDTAMHEFIHNPTRWNYRYRESKPDWGFERHIFDVDPIGAPATHEHTAYDRTRRFGYDPALARPVGNDIGPNWEWLGHPEWRRDAYRDPDEEDWNVHGFNDEVQADPSMLYRGLSHEEWEQAKQRGYLQSNGEYNIGGEGEGNTMYSTDPDQAHSYAVGFAPWHRKPGFNTPSYVLGIPRPQSAYPHPGFTPSDTNEIVVPGQVPFDQVQQAWQFRPYVMPHGDMDLRTENFGKTWTGRPSTSGIAQYAYRPVPLPLRTMSKLAHPLYVRWVFSPATGNVELADNGEDPLSVRYHTDLAQQINEPNLVHGYAYRIGDGWRLTDWDSKPVEDPYIVAQVMRKLRGSQASSGPQDGSWTPSQEDDWDRVHLGLPG